MLHRLEVETSVTNSANALAKASRIIIPGVGIFSDATRKLDVIKGLRSTLRIYLSKGRCLSSASALACNYFLKKVKRVKALGLVSLKEVHRIPASGLKVPHMGWNDLKIAKKDPLFNNFDQRSRFYFVHSFAVKPKSNRVVLARTEYGDRFCSVVRHHKIYGVQFHPEKSHRYGIQLLKNFCEIPNAA